MKLDQISNKFTLIEGNWVAKSLDGVEKRFPTSDTAGRDAWAASYAKPQPSAAPANPKNSDLDLDTIWRKVEDVISRIFPDGDPIDWLIPWFKKHGITDFKIGDLLDQAAQKNGYNDIYDYYDQMKQQYSSDNQANEGAHANTIGAIASYAPDPKPGDTIRTRKMQMQGKVEKVEPYQGYIAVYFRTQDDRLMRTPLSNVTVIEKLADSEIEEVNETFPYDIDHMSGKTIKGEFENKTVRYFYNEWKELADRANSEQHDNNLVISSGPTTVIYQGDDGTIYAQWDKIKKIGFIKGKTTEGMMGGINRSAPAQDVSYEKVLDEVMGMWKEACRTDELSVDTMKNYRKAATSPAAVQTRPLRKLAKSVVGVKKAGDKIAAKTGDRTGGRPKYGQISTGTYEERLAEFLNIEEDFGDIVRKQDNSPKPGQTIDKQYNGWTIRYQLSPKQPGQPIQWMAWHSKKDPETAKKGTASSPEQAFQDATAFINSGGGVENRTFNSSHVTIDFNVNFSREIVPGGDGFFASIDNGFIIVSLVPQEGFKKSHIRTDTVSGEKFWTITMSKKEAEAQKLVPNGRYLLGNKDEIDSETWMFSIHFQSIAQDSRDRLRMNAPGFTVASSRAMDEDCWDGYEQIGMKNKGGKQVPNCVPTNEVYQDPWQGDPQKYAKAPKSTSWGKGSVTLSQMVQDSIDEHGVKWAFEYYVKKHGMPPRHFRIYAGL